MVAFKYEFLFSCSEFNLISHLFAVLVNYRVEHLKTISISKHTHVL